MIKKTSPNKIWKIILKSKPLRVLSSLCIVFIVFILIFITAGNIYSNKILANQGEIKQTKSTITSLQSIIEFGKEGEIDNDLLEAKQFAEYQEVIPFITYMEGLFSAVDPKAELTIKSKEEQIFIDHYADYKVGLKVGQKKELFYKALDELYNSQYITQFTNFTMNYKPLEDGSEIKLSNVEFTVRLFLK